MKPTLLLLRRVPFTLLLLRRVPFTLLMLGGLALAALLTNTYMDREASTG